MMTLRTSIGLTMMAAGALTKCGGEAPGIAGHIETMDERAKRQKAEFDAMPDIKGEELHQRLNALGIRDAWMKQVVEPDHGIKIFELRVPEADFAKLDLGALSKLLLDSHYRFEFLDKGQIRTFAFAQGRETRARDKAKALKQLAERGQLDTYPRYREGMLMSAFAPRLEAWCGYREGQALRVVDGAWVDYQHEMVDLAVTDKDGRASASFDCMKRVVDASTELQRRFIGNRGRQGAIDT